MPYYLNELIWVLSVGDKFLSTDRSNLLKRELPLVPGAENNPALCFQGDERTGLFSYDTGTIGISCLGFVSFLISNSALTLRNKKAQDIRLELPTLSVPSVTQKFQPLSGTLSLTSDHWYTKINAEATDDIFLGQAIKLDATADCLRALADTSSNYAIGVAVSSGAPTEDVLVTHMGLITQEDWTEVTGTTLLTTGSRYYLSDTDPGQLVTVAPSNVQLIGIAVNTNTLQLAINHWT